MPTFIDFVFYFVHKPYAITKVTKHCLVTLYYIDKIDSHAILNSLTEKAGMNS